MPKRMQVLVKWESKVIYRILFLVLFCMPFYAAAQPSPAMCRAEIDSLVCVSARDPWFNGKPSTESRCDTVGAHDVSLYVASIQSAFDKLTPRMQIQFCKLKQIYLERDIAASGYTNAELNEYGSMQPIIGFRRSIFDSQLSASHWATWKEQTNFGASLASYEPVEGAPRVEVNSQNGMLTGADLIVFHEIAHVFDFTNDVSPRPSCEGIACDIQDHHFASISWESIENPKIDDQFLNRDLLCFYDCLQNRFPAEKSLGLYKAAHDTSFTTLYSSKNPWDDFAELYLLATLNRLGATYRVVLGGGESFDLIEKLNTPSVQQKMRWLP